MGPGQGQRTSCGRHRGEDGHQGMVEEANGEEGVSRAPILVGWGGGMKGGGNTHRLCRKQGNHVLY